MLVMSSHLPSKARSYSIPPRLCYCQHRCRVCGSCRKTKEDYYYKKIQLCALEIRSEGNCVFLLFGGALSVVVVIIVIIVVFHIL